MKRLLPSFLYCLFIISTLQGQADHKETIRAWHAGSSARTVQSFIYTLTSFNATYTEITGGTSLNEGEIWDEPTYIMPLAFPFVINGNPVTELEFYGAGSLMRAPTSDPLVYNFIFPFEADLIDRGAFGTTSLSPITYTVVGAPGSRIQIMQFKNAGSYNEMDFNGTLDMFVNFQMWLYEGSNSIEYRFGPSFINDPALFYDDETGPLSGLTDYDEDNDILSNEHFIVGAAGNPSLSANVSFVNGTPPDGKVYRLYIPAPLELNIIGVNATSSCNPNGSATAEVAGGLSPYTYLWSNGATTTAITNLDAGTYSLTVTDSNGDTAIGFVSITNVEPLDLIVVTTDETAVAANDGTADAQVSGGLPPYSYQWNTGETTAFIENLPPGVYNVVVTDANGCTAEQTGIVNAFGCPELLIEASVQNVSCNGACDGSISIVDVINGSGDYTYNWNNGSTLSTLINLCNGLYDVTITDATGCIVIGIYEITQPDTLIVTAGSTDEYLLNQNDGTAWAIPTGGTAPYTYAWSNGSTDSLILNLIPGVYTVTVTDDHGCTASAEAAVAPGPCGIIQNEIINTACFGDCNGSIVLSVINNFPPITYTWDNEDTTSLITDLCAGDYVVTVMDANGCTVIDTFTVNQPDLLIVNVSGTDETESFNDGTAWAAPTGGTPPYTYAWSNGSTDSLIVNLMPGEYTVTVTDSHGCESNDSVSVDSFCQGTIEGAIQRNSCVDTCDWRIISYVMGGEGPFTYVWSTGDTTHFALENLCPGEYSVTITDQSGQCQYLSTYDIIKPDPLIVIIDTVIHLTDTTTASISISVSLGNPPYSYIWLGPNGFLSQEEDITGIPPGYYSVQVYTDVFDCGQIDSILVEDFTTSITTIPDRDLNIYPNPAHDKVFIKGLDINEFDIHLFDTAGMEIKSWKNANTLDVADVLPGWYFLKISFGKNTITRSLIIQR